MKAQAEIEKAKEKEYEGYTSEIDDLCAFIFKHVLNFDFNLIDEKLERDKGETVRKARMANPDPVALETEIINIVSADSDIPATSLPENEVPIGPPSDIILPATPGFDDSYGDLHFRPPELDDEMCKDVEEGEQIMDP